MPLQRGARRTSAVSAAVLSARLRTVHRPVSRVSGARVGKVISAAADRGGRLAADRRVGAVAVHVTARHMPDAPQR